MKNAYLYSRVSRGTQTKGTGLTRQDLKGLDICKAKGWNLVPDNLSDVGSAHKGSNILKGSLGRFIQAANDGKLKPNPVLILEQWDRFSRQDVDTSFDEARRLLRCGVDIHIAFGDRTFTAEDLKQSYKRMEMEIAMQQAYDYSANLSKRVNGAFQQKYQLAREGKAIQLGNWQPNWVDFVGENKQVGEFHLNEKADVIRRIVCEYIANRSMWQIAVGLNKDHISCIGEGKTKAKHWTQGLVWQILHSPALIGTLVVKEQTFERYYPAVVTDNEYKLLQTRISTNERKKGGLGSGRNYNNLFPNRVRCAHCGGTATTQISAISGGKRTYYKCYVARMNPDKCKVRRMLAVNAVEQDFFLLFLKQNPVELLGKNTGEHEDKIADLNDRLAKTDRDIEEGVELLGTIKQDALRKKLTTLQDQKSRLIKQREELTKKMVSQSDLPTAFTDIRRALLGVNTDRWDDFDKAAEQMIEMLADPEVRRRLVGLLPSLVEGIVVDLEKGEYQVVMKDGTQTAFRSVVELPTID